MNYREAKNVCINKGYFLYLAVFLSSETDLTLDSLWVKKLNRRIRWAVLNRLFNRQPSLNL